MCVFLRIKLRESMLQYIDWSWAFSWNLLPGVYIGSLSNRESSGLPPHSLRPTACLSIRARLWGKCPEASTLASGISCVLQSSFSSNKASILTPIQLLCLFTNPFTEAGTPPMERVRLHSKKKQS